MAINASSPVVVDGIEYPHYAVQLSITPRIGAADVTGTMVMRLTPYRVRPDNTIEALGTEHVKSHIVSDVFERAALDPVFAQALAAVYQAIAGYVSAKEL